MMQRFIRDTQNEVLQHLSELVNLLNQDKIQKLSGIIVVWH